MKKGWEIKNFEDVCQLIGGSQPAKDEFLFEPKEGYIRLIQVRDYRTSKFMTYIPQEKARRFCNKEDIMIGRYGPPIFGIFKGLEGAYNVALMKAEVNEEICNKNYFFLFLKTDKLLKFVEHSSKRAAGQDGIRKELLDKYPVPLPSLSEQQRIVSIIEKSFAAINKAKANAEQNLKNAKELFESYLQEVFEKRGKGWEVKSLGDVAITNGRIGWKGLTAKEYTEEGPLFVSVHSLNHGDYIDFRKSFHISQSRYDESPEIMLKKDDILICKDGAGIGKLGIVPELPNVATINSSLLLIRCKSKITTKYLYYNLLSPNFQSIVQSRLSGATTPHLYQRDIVTFPILLPTLLEQKAIVQKLDALSTETKKLEYIYKQKITDLEELKKSVLQKAFSGEL